MSKFIEAMHARENGDRKAKIPPIKTYISQLPAEMTAMDMPLLRGYDIMTSYSQRVFCDPMDLDRMISNSKKVVKEYMYGDLRNRLLELDRAVAEGDDMLCRSLIRDLIREVFD